MRKAVEALASLFGPHPDLEVGIAPVIDIGSDEFSSMTRRPFSMMRKPEDIEGVLEELSDTVDGPVHVYVLADSSTYFLLSYDFDKWYPTLLMTQALLLPQDATHFAFISSQKGFNEREVVKDLLALADESSSWTLLRENIAGKLDEIGYCEDRVSFPSNKTKFAKILYPNPERESPSMPSDIHEKLLAHMACIPDESLLSMMPHVLSYQVLDEIVSFTKWEGENDIRMGYTDEAFKSFLKIVVEGEWPFSERVSANTTITPCPFIYAHDPRIESLETEFLPRQREKSQRMLDNIQFSGFNIGLDWESDLDEDLAKRVFDVFRDLDPEEVWIEEEDVQGQRIAELREKCSKVGEAMMFDVYDVKGVYDVRGDYPVEIRNDLSRAQAALSGTPKEVPLLGNSAISTTYADVPLVHSSHFCGTFARRGIDFVYFISPRPKSGLLKRGVMDVPGYWIAPKDPESDFEYVALEGVEKVKFSDMNGRAFSVISKEADTSRYAETLSKVIQYLRLDKMMDSVSDRLSLDGSSYDLAGIASNILKTMDCDDGTEIPDLKEISGYARSAAAMSVMISEIDPDTPAYPWEAPLKHACEKMAVWLNVFSSEGIWIYLEDFDICDLDVFAKLNEIALDLGVDSALEAFDAGVSLDDIIA